MLLVFSLEFCEICKATFLQNTTDRLLLIIAVSIAVKGELANETVDYDIEIKAYQFESEVQVIKKGSAGERRGLTRAFEEGVRNNVLCDFQQYIPKSTGKKAFAAPKIRIPDLASKNLLLQTGFFVERFFSMFFCHCFFFTQTISCYFYHEKYFLQCSSHIASSEILTFRHS